MDHFPVPRLREFRDAAMSAGVGIPEKRDLLLAGIDSLITSDLKLYSGPRDQIYGDLIALNRIERVADGSVPILIWLDNAEDQAKPRPQAAIFGNARDEVAAQTEVRPPIAPAPPPKEPIEIIAQDENLPVGFLRKGYEAAISVAKLLVHRYDSGLPAETAAGQPMVFSATAWLLTPGLLITNHHAMSARPAQEIAASVADLRLQAENSIAHFDFDSDGDEGVKVPILSLEAFDPGLDYAILRTRELPGRNGLRIAREDNGNRPRDYVPLNIIHHANARYKKISIRNNLMMSSTENELRFVFDGAGSGGSPVLDDQWSVMALYRGHVTVSNVRFQGRQRAFVGVGARMPAILEHIKANSETLWREIEHGILYR